QPTPRSPLLPYTPLFRSRLRLQPPIGVLPLDENRGRLDARFLTVVNLQHLDLEAPAFRPARVHAQQHRGPVLALGAAGAGVYFRSEEHTSELQSRENLVC